MSRLEKSLIGVTLATALATSYATGCGSDTKDTSKQNLPRPTYSVDGKVQGAKFFMKGDDGYLLVLLDVGTGPAPCFVHRYSQNDMLKGARREIELLSYKEHGTMMRIAGQERKNNDDFANLLKSADCTGFLTIEPVDKIAK